MCRLNRDRDDVIKTEFYYCSGCICDVCTFLRLVTKMLFVSVMFSFQCLISLVFV